MNVRLLDVLVLLDAVVRGEVPLPEIRWGSAWAGPRAPEPVNSLIDAP
jgi:hypothetical protein